VLRYTTPTGHPLPVNSDVNTDRIWFPFYVCILRRHGVISRGTLAHALYKRSQIASLVQPTLHPTKAKMARLQQQTWMVWMIFVSCLIAQSQTQGNLVVLAPQLSRRLHAFASSLSEMILYIAMCKHAVDRTIADVVDRTINPQLSPFPLPLARLG